MNCNYTCFKQGFNSFARVIIMSTALPRTLLIYSRLSGNSSNTDLASLIFFFFFIIFNEIVYKCGPFIPLSKDARKSVGNTDGHVHCTGSSLNMELLCLSAEQLNGRKCEVMI